MYTCQWGREARVKASQDQGLGRRPGYILSHANMAGYPTNRPGSDKTPGQGYFGPNKLDSYLYAKGGKGFFIYSQHWKKVKLIIRIEIK